MANLKPRPAPAPRPKVRKKTGVTNSSYRTPLKSSDPLFGLPSTLTLKKKKFGLSLPWVWSMGTVVLILSIFAAGIGYAHYESTLLSFEVPPNPFQTSASRSALPAQVTIPSVKLEFNLYSAKIQGKNWNSPLQGAAYQITSARPTEAGNIIIYGFNKTENVAALKFVKVGDMITVKTSEGKDHPYLVRETKVISTSDTTVFESTDQEVLILFTNAGFLNTKRLVIKAAPIKKASL